MTQQTDMELDECLLHSPKFAKYLLETLAPNLRKAGQTATADDVEDAGRRLLHAAEIIHTLLDEEWTEKEDEAYDY